jgi:hypothetical protein
MNSTLEERAANHEAGHVIAGLQFGLDFSAVSIDSNLTTDGALGVVLETHDWSGEAISIDQAKGRVIQLLAGPEAERVLIGKGQESGGIDLFEAGGTAHVHGLGDMNGYHLAAQELVKENWFAIRAVAEELLRHKTLTYSQVIETLQRLAAKGTSRAA